jgi:putative chitinase
MSSITSSPALVSRLRSVLGAEAAGDTVPGASTDAAAPTGLGEAPATERSEADPLVAQAARMIHAAADAAARAGVAVERPTAPATQARRGLSRATAGREEMLDRRTEAAATNPSTTPCTAATEPAITLGSRAADDVAARHGFTVADVAELLRSLGYDQPDVRQALQALQQDAGLLPTGELDLETLLAMLGAALTRDRRSRANAAGSPHGSINAGRPSSSEGGYGPGAVGGLGGAGSAGGVADVSRPIAQTAPVDVSNWTPGAGDVTTQQLQSIVPSLSAGKAAEVAPHLNRAMAEAGIDSPARKAAFIAQVAHESGGFQYNEEIASGRAYEGRSDLGNTQPGDGERFKGRGYIQLTGRANYAAAGKALGLDLVNNPALAARPENAARVAAWYWNSRGLNGLADRGDFDGITKRINGGFNGKADRDQYHARAQGVLKDSVGLPSTGRFVDSAATTTTATTGATTATAGGAGSVGNVDTNHPHLRALATGRLVGAGTGLCVTATLDNMQRNGVPQPAATGVDEGNNPRGGMVQMIRNHGWTSLPGVGAPQTIRSPYGTVQANVIPAHEYEQLARAGQIPSGAVVFQTRHPTWNMTSPRSRGFDMGIARDGGRNLFNFADMGGPMVYPDTKSVVVLVPGGAVR